MELDCAGRPLDLSRPCVMGILNVTPDSFSDGGRWSETGAAVEHAMAMVEAGAAIIDVGGESTRPNADPVDEAEERARVLPVIEQLVRILPVPVSIDTSKPGIMRDAVAAGASFINDVYALRASGALEAAAAAGVPVCLMHMQGQPRSMQSSPHYDDVVGEVSAFLESRAQACLAAGIPRGRIVIDPGIGFGKTLAHNLELLSRLDGLVDLGYPVLVGASRKSLIGRVTGQPVTDRLSGSLTVAALAVWQGAHIIRVHDVAETVQALTVTHAMMQARVA